MKKIEAIIRKTKFEEVKDSLLEADIEWLLRCKRYRKIQTSPYLPWCTVRHQFHRTYPHLYRCTR